MSRSVVVSREDVWEALAEHFLDTETRTWIPQAALTCVEAGLSREQAFRVWAYEVTPALWSNLWNVAGEWAGWDQRWLVARIERARIAPSCRAYLLYRGCVHLNHRTWIAIGRCIDLLEETDPPQRRKLAADLAWLARQFFDFGRSGAAPPSSEARLRAIYRETFLPVFAPLVLRPGGDPPEAASRQRVEQALGAIGDKQWTR
jgi:hypothetical protein